MSSDLEVTVGESAPLLPPKKTNKQLKDEIKQRLLLACERHLNAVENALDFETLSALATLSDDDIKEIVSASYKKFSKRSVKQRFIHEAFARKFDQLTPNVKHVVAFYIYEIERTLWIGYHDFPTPVYHFVIDNLLDRYHANQLSFSEKRKLTSPRNGIVSAVLREILFVLDSWPRPAERGITVESLLARLNKFEPSIIRRELATLSPDYRDDMTQKIFNKLREFERDEKYFSEYYPRIKHVMAIYATREFDDVLNSIWNKVGKFRAKLREKLATCHNDADKIYLLQNLVLRFVEEIGTSRFKGKQEDMLKSCLHTLMELSDPLKGISLDPRLLSRCMGIVSRYFSKKKQANFFNAGVKDYWRRKAILLRTLPALGGFETLQPFVSQVRMPKKSIGDAFKKEDESFKTFAIKIGLYSIQTLLLGAINNEKPFDIELARECMRPERGGDLNHCNEKGINFLERALAKQCMGDNAPWEFYREYLPTMSAADFWFAVIDVYIFKKHVRPDDELNKAIAAKCNLMVQSEHYFPPHRINAVLAKRLLLRLNNYLGTEYAQDLKVKLEECANPDLMSFEQPPVAGKDKGETEEDATSLSAHSSEHSVLDSQASAFPRKRASQGEIIDAMVQQRAQLQTALSGEQPQSQLQPQEEVRHKLGGG